MRIRAVGASTLLLILAACSSSPGETALPGASTGVPAAPGATGSTASAASGTAAAIDLSGVDVCAIVPETTVQALTGETEFRTDDRTGRDLASCFWGVPKAGVPQYLEVTVERRTKPLGDYGLNINNIPCPGVDIPGIGAEARGGVCPQSQNRVWLIVLDRGVSVKVEVNEPKGTLTPEGLADVVKAILAGLPLG